MAVILFYILDYIDWYYAHLKENYRGISPWTAKHHHITWALHTFNLKNQIQKGWWMRKWNGADDCGNLIGLSWSFGGESGRSCSNEAMVTMKQTTLMTTEMEWCWLLHKSNGTTSIVRWRNRTEAATMKTTMTMTRWHWWLRKWKNTSIVRWRNQGEASIM